MTSSTGFISDQAGNDDIETIPPSSSSKIIYNIVRRKSSEVSSDNDDNFCGDELKKQTNRKSGLFGTSVREHALHSWALLNMPIIDPFCSAAFVSLLGQSC